LAGSTEKYSRLMYYIRGVLQIQNQSRRSTNHRRILTRPVLTVATGLGFATRPRSLIIMSIIYITPYIRNYI